MTPRCSCPRRMARLDSDFPKSNRRTRTTRVPRRPARRGTWRFVSRPMAGQQPDGDDDSRGLRRAPQTGCAAMAEARARRPRRPAFPPSIAAVGKFQQQPHAAQHAKRADDLGVDREGVKVIRRGCEYRERARPRSGGTGRHAERQSPCQPCRERSNQHHRHDGAKVAGDANAGSTITETPGAWIE